MAFVYQRNWFTFRGLIGEELYGIFRGKTLQDRTEGVFEGKHQNIGGGHSYTLLWLVVNKVIRKYFPCVPLSRAINTPLCLKIQENSIVNPLKVRPPSRECLDNLAQVFCNGFCKIIVSPISVMSGRIPTCDEGPYINVIVDNSINSFLLLS